MELRGKAGSPSDGRTVQALRSTRRVEEIAHGRIAGPTFPINSKIHQHGHRRVRHRVCGIGGLCRAADMTTPSNVLLLYAARGVRGFGDGFAIIILPAYLSAIGYDPVQIGIVATASLLGTALLTLVIGAIAARFDLRTLAADRRLSHGMHRVGVSQRRAIRLRRAGGVRRHGQSLDRRSRRAGADRARHAGAWRRRPGANPHLRPLQPDRRAFDGGRRAWPQPCPISWCWPASAR